MGMTRTSCLVKGVLLFPSTGEAGVLVVFCWVPTPKAASSVPLGTSGDLASLCHPVGLFSNDLESSPGRDCWFPVLSCAVSWESCSFNQSLSH